MANCDLSETSRSKVKLVFKILPYSDIIKHIKELSMDIQTHSEGWVILVYSDPGIFGNMANSEL